MKDCLIIDVSYPDDVFMINVKVEPLVDETILNDEKIYQLAYEADKKFIGILEWGKTASECKLTGKVKLTDFQMKMVHEGILEKYESKRLKKPAVKQRGSRIW